jgi:hypothetical protein
VALWTGPTKAKTDQRRNRYKNTCISIAAVLGKEGDWDLGKDESAVLWARALFALRFVVELGCDFKLTLGPNKKCRALPTFTPTTTGNLQQLSIPSAA